jgi:tetratricopeptide (TPR) repeat protein
MSAEMDIDDGHLNRAEERLNTVLQRAPNFLRAIMLRAKCYSSQARIRDAAEVIEAVLKRKPNNQIALRNLGQAYAEANQHEQAAEAYRRMLEIDPAQLDIANMHAHELRMLGRKEEAKASFRHALTIDPNSGAAWWGLANFFPDDISEADVVAMNDALGRLPEIGEDRGPLNVALGLVAERRGDHAAAFRHIAAGKEHIARSRPFDADAEGAKVDELIRGVTPERFAAYRGAGYPDNAPIFIIGMPRSGTTLLERILGGHSQIEAGGELPIIARMASADVGSSSAQTIARWRTGETLSADEVYELGKTYIDRSRDYRLTDKPRFIDKNNFNWFRIGLIRLMLPNARVIDMRRNALDCCWANFKMMFADAHAAANDQRNIARFYRDYVRMVEAVDAAAPGGILKVRYEELVDDIEGETRRILDFLDLEYEPECIDFHLSTGAVATPSSEQVRRPINRDSIGSAEPYRQWLTPMIEELGALAG